MDSLTQAVLGATVSTAVLGPRIGARRAAVAGAILGTVPDLDVFVPLGDPVADFVLHRGPSHSLVIQALVTPLFAEPLVRLFQGLRDRRWRTYLAVYLVFVTHALLDAITIYGTRIFWGIDPDPVGVASLFIIDPLYSLPLIVATVWALCLKGWSPRVSRVVNVALILSTVYVGWSMVGQRIAEARGHAELERLGITAQRTIATPMPFNTLFWRVIAIERDRYLNIYVPLLGGQGDVTAYAHARGGDLLACAHSLDNAQRLMAFAKGFFKLEEAAGRLRVVDLRMGVTPGYVFQFEVAERAGDGEMRAIEPVRIDPNRDVSQGWDWLWASILGERRVRAVEAANLIEVPQAFRVAGPTAHSASTCSPG